MIHRGPANGLQISLALLALSLGGCAGRTTESVIVDEIIDVNRLMERCSKDNLSACDQAERKWTDIEQQLRAYCEDGTPATTAMSAQLCAACAGIGKMKTGVKRMRHSERLNGILVAE